MCRSCPKLPFVRGIPVCPEVSPNFTEVVVAAVEVHLIHGVAMDMLRSPRLAMPFWEKGMLAEMLCEETENGGPVWKRTEFVC